MLIKLLKYDLKAISRIIIPLYIASFFLAIISGFFIKFGPFDTASGNFLPILLPILFILLMCTLTAAILFSFILSIYHFRQNTFCSEGYLINTLPITARQNINSKLITAILFEILSVIVAIIIYILLVFIYAEITIMDLFKCLNVVFEYTINLNGNQVLLIFELLVLMLSALFLFNTKVYAAISVGHSYTSHKILKSVAAYILFDILESIIIIIIANFILKIRPFYLSSNTPILLLGLIVFLLFYTTIYYLITNHFVKNKLNLQ